MRGLKPNPCGAIARISLNGTQKIVKGARRFIRRLTASSSSIRANSVKVDASTFGDLYKIVRRRALEAEINGGISPHMFRATGISVYLENGGTLEHAQQIAVHESARTTKLYGELAADPKSRA